MIGIHGAISWKGNFSVKRMIFYMKTLAKTTARGKMEQWVSGQSSNSSISNR